MSKSDGRKIKDTSGTGFRKIDVDQFENHFKEEDPDGTLTGPDENEILAFLSQGKHAEALISVLKSAPLGSKNQQVKDNARNLTQKVLLSIKTNQMEDCIAQLDQNLMDTLMKYIYRGFELPSEGSSGHLLVWHEKLYNISGVGSIVRVFADSKRA
ncbi:actin-related protein 2/3 complex subunit 5 isoform X2 [Copidosoma floridanum]|uniref:actin-related protein 2/3 complex subunit 5 isoform X1 n=1 Tax=Copidosoma floridanum TaxID=29053 RepID=UPI0006C942D7|nr:actin-related protein 2/3 complex subunit 5 isoform X1 [Copidosoma floridanum]XP_023247433.1 actin-related protein 2/3 complex subunit 5 isoform X2 [Copidosoma floridanum]